MIGTNYVCAHCIPVPSIHLLYPSLRAGIHQNCIPVVSFDLLTQNVLGLCDNNDKSLSRYNHNNNVHYFYSSTIS